MKKEDKEKLQTRVLEPPDDRMRTIKRKRNVHEGVCCKKEEKEGGGRRGC